MRITDTVKHLIIVNIIFFAASFFVPAIQQLFAMYYFDNPNFYAWQPLTHMFMHGGLMHIFFNMFALFSFGTTLESIWGGKKFFTFYLLCGLGAALLHTGVNYYNIHSAVSTLGENGYNASEVMDLLAQGRYDMRWGGVLGNDQLMNFLSAYNTPVVGASGAIYGLLVAFAFMFPNAELMMMFIPVPVKAKYFVPGILLLDLYGGVAGSFSLFGGGGGIAHFAHIGGALMGYLIMVYYKKTQFNRNRWDR
ncbi:rhomboid family intramembrane serine protease [Myroides marinus]|uniref:Membrane associated serine protease, rhomboid family n=1 Tax=Myroides marinus TaxID=703342 RepID=A0A1H6VQR2_9FLAO|nr:rhomboid family intramembrane serine protease [Myroides marinus]MDM1369131.1 rhomboid family intramembrane serine protease [Myroides marinus]MDM1372070.1 rhomboid family intramembrane serine protease [Myroides marinus]MDM1376015.1 rhomboid family intramembrane serine protease [Myroides marinus]MDM1379642.1 rhomboid family intramembrane serine protease [Myroides marinus]MDM1383074.1 rhomboid family intramembrane serine protease [Myroides marinus]